MYKDYYWLNSHSRTFLERGYLKEGVTPEQRIREIAENAEKILNKEGFADKFEHYMRSGFYSLSTPCWTNFGNERGLPVSCYSSVLDDTMRSILEKASEVGMMSKYGGGTSAYFGNLRPRGASISVGGESSGPVHFMEIYETISNVTSQGSARRGSFAAYLPVEHPDIEEFLQIRSEGHPIQNMSIGVTISDEFMQGVVDGDKQKRKIWAKIIQKRFETGYPYIFFSDSVNNNAPKAYRDASLKLLCSNLCSEICLFSDSSNSFVCVLSSLNLLHWDKIKETDAIETLIYFLDSVNEEFIRKTENLPHMQTAHNFAKTQRALGAGVLGWHSYLQSKSLTFESFDAKLLNAEIWKTIRERADRATEQMAIEYGEPELLRGLGRRNVTTLAVAPTTSCAVPETKFISENSTINFFDLFERGGLDLNNYMTFDVELESGEIRQYHYNDKIQVKRNNENVLILASDLVESDEIV